MLDRHPNTLAHGKGEHANVHAINDSDMLMAVGEKSTQSESKACTVDAWIIARSCW